MFDFAFSEIALVGVVALIVIGPKDMPVAVKALTDVIKKARRMAGEFQGHVDEMMREADLHEVRDGIRELRSMNIKGRILSAVDGDGTIRRSLEEDPLRAAPATTAAVTSLPADGARAHPDIVKPAVAGAAPAFVPPPAAPALPAAPAFIPPGIPASVPAGVFAGVPPGIPPGVPPDAARDPQI